MGLTTQELIDNAEARQPDNSNGEISAADTREQNKDVAINSYNKESDKHLVGLNSYDPSRTYEVGESVTFDVGGGNLLYTCTASTTGAFDVSKWGAVGVDATAYSLEIDQAKANGLELQGTNPQKLGIETATASKTGALSKEDWAAFNAKQAALGFTPIDVNQKGNPEGVAPLDSSGVVPFSYLPAALAGALDYEGTYNAATNTPTLTDSGGTIRQYYIVNVPGVVDLGSGSLSLNAGDFLIHDGNVFEQIIIQVQPGGDGIPTIGGSTDRGLVTWNGTTGTAVRSNDVKIDENGFLVFQTAKGINGGESGLYQTQTVFGTGVAVQSLAALPDASHFVFAGAAVTKDNFPYQGNGQLVLDPQSLWFKNNDVWVDLLAGLKSTTTGEPTGATVIGNEVSISQIDYDLATIQGTLVPTTIYNIIEA
jgi:hypothetical protein